MSLILNLLAAAMPHFAWAGCGCDKPPPQPAAVVPHVAFPGMSVILSDESFVAGQIWQVSFSNDTMVMDRTGVVAAKRLFADVSGQTVTPQLVVTVPELPPGPTQIVATIGDRAVVVPADDFTVIGQPVMISTKKTHYQIERYSTAVAADRTVYVSLSGLQNFCQATKFHVRAPSGLPLHFANGGVVIFNAQGVAIDTLATSQASYFSMSPAIEKNSSDLLRYFRHSFARYCADHRAGGRKEIDATDPNWHRDGSFHVDYSTLIFAIVGNLPDGSLPRPGKVTLELDIETEVADADELWQMEEDEEELLE